ncbi:unnamed protein product, partial [marine sediment metagenome]
LERSIDIYNPENGEVPIKILGFGEISLVFELLSDVEPIAYKRIPIFDNEKCCLKATRDLFDFIQNEVPVLYHVCGDNGVIDKDGRDMLQLVASTKAAILDLDYQVDLKKAKEKI